jgi:hypothetical protein
VHEGGTVIARSCSDVDYHQQNHGVSIHCAIEVELIYALAEMKKHSHAQVIVSSTRQVRMAATTINALQSNCIFLAKSAAGSRPTIPAMPNQIRPPIPLQSRPVIPVQIDQVILSYPNNFSRLVLFGNRASAMFVHGHLDILCDPLPPFASLSSSRSKQQKQTSTLPLRRARTFAQVVLERLVM